MRKTWIIFLACLLVSCSRETGKQEVVTTPTGTPELAVTTSEVTTTTTTSESTTSEEQVTTTTTTTATTRTPFNKLKTFMSSVNADDVIIDYFSSTGEITKTRTLEDTMKTSFTKLLTSYKQIETCDWNPTMKLTFPQGSLYVARQGDVYRFGLDSKTLVGEFSDTEFFDKLAAYDKNTFMNLLNTKGEQVYQIDDYFLNIEYNEETNVYTLPIETSKYGLISYYDFNNDLYYSKFFDVDLFDMNKVSYDFVNQIGYVNSCIYEISGITYSACTDKEISIIKQHINRLLNDGNRYLSTTDFYKELGYEDLKLMSEYENILYKELDESLYRERNLFVELPEEYATNEQEYHMSTLVDDVKKAGVIAKVSILSDNTPFDYGETFKGEANDVIYSSYKVHVEEYLKGSCNDSIDVMYAGGYLNGTFTNSDFFEELVKGGTYILMLDKVANEVDENLYEVHNIYAPHNVMYFKDAKLSIWLERASHNIFVGGAEEEKVETYIKELIAFSK